MQAVVRQRHVGPNRYSESPRLTAHESRGIHKHHRYEANDQRPPRCAISQADRRSCFSRSVIRVFLVTGCRTPVTDCPPLRRVPDRTCVSPVLHRHGDLLGHLDSEAFGVVGRPARSGDLDNAHVVEGALLRVEIRILPVGRE